MVGSRSCMTGGVWTFQAGCLAPKGAQGRSPGRSPSWYVCRPSGFRGGVWCSGGFPRFHPIIEMSKAQRQAGSLSYIALWRRRCVECALALNVIPGGALFVRQSAELAFDELVDGTIHDSLNVAGLYSGAMVFHHLVRLKHV